MPKLRTALTVTTAALGLAALAAAPTAAAPQPAFLTAAQMPPSSTPWTADPVTTGLPEGGAFCAPGEIPARNTRHRAFRTELDTNGLQITTVARTEAAAAQLVDTLRTALAGCGTRIEQQDPSTTAVSAYHGKLAVEEGAWVYSLDTANTEIGNTDIHLFSVGRDGRTVTYVQWGQLGDLTDAPLAAFRTTTRTAVDKLY